MGAGDNALTEAERNEGWKLLFDGETLDGWGATGNDEGCTPKRSSRTTP